MRVMSIKDFEWAAAAQWIVWFASAAGVQEVGEVQINSFPLGRVGVDRLLKRKQKLQLVCDGNIAQIERFMGQWGKDVDSETLAVARAFYAQWKRYSETVKNHVDRLLVYEAMEQDRLVAEAEAETEEEDYDLPF